MRINDVSFPYPVLRMGNDDIRPLLKDDCIVMSTPVKYPNYYEFSIKLNQENEYITSLIQEGLAEYACEVECRETFMRKCYYSSTPEFTIKVDRKSVFGRINFSCFIATKVPIKDYINPQFNEDYIGHSFDLETGDLLAIFPAAYYNTEVKYDKLYAAGSFMQITEGRPTSERPFFDLSGDKINIELPPAMFEQYRTFANSRFIESIHASLVYNALVFAIQEMLKNELHEGKIWYDSIDQRIKSDANLKLDYNSSLYDIYEVADVLLGNPYKRLFERMQDLNSL